MCTVRNYCANHCTFKFVNIDYITMSKNVTLAVITLLRLPELLAHKTLSHTHKTDKDAGGVAFFVKRSECENPI